MKRITCVALSLLITLVLSIPVFAQFLSLPESIVWRIKVPFGSGAGSSAIMSSLCEKQGSVTDFAAHQQTEEGLRLNSAEELNYYQIFKSRFPHPTMARLVARWDPAKGDFNS